MEEAVENQDKKILWNFNIGTNRIIETRRPDIALIDKKIQKTFIIDIAILEDFDVRNKKTEKISKC